MPYSSALYTNWSRIHLFLHISIRLPFSVVISLVGVISYAFSFLSLTSSNANRRWWQCENIPLLCLSHHTLFSAYFTCISLVSSFQSLYNCHQTHNVPAENGSHSAPGAQQWLIATAISRSVQQQTCRKPGETVACIIQSLFTLHAESWHTAVL